MRTAIIILTLTACYVVAGSIDYQVALDAAAEHRGAAYRVTVAR